MYEDDFTNKVFTMDVGGGHRLKVWDWGNPQAKTPYIFLHGGPGSACRDKHKRVFDPSHDRVIFFDQRGAGESTPTGSLEHNTTQELISDISAIADHVGIKKFALHGTSWGSALALAYALEQPKRVSALVIGGIFTGSKAEIAWLDQGYFKTFYPEVWEAYLERTPEQYRANPSAYHFDRALNGTHQEQKVSAYAYQCLEAGAIRLDDRFQPSDYETFDPAGMRIEMHYLANDCFMLDRHILDHAHTLTMPVHIVQGRYDMVCPPQTAYELHQKLSSSQLYWTISGHASEHEDQAVFTAIIAGLRR